jgi:hypothetical protein
VDGLTAVGFGERDDPIAVEVGGGRAKIDGEGGGEGVLRVRVWVGVDGGRADAVGGGGAVDAPG